MRENIYKIQFKKYDVVRVGDYFYEAKRLQKLLKMLKRSKKDISAYQHGTSLIIAFEGGRYEFNPCQQVVTDFKAGQVEHLPHYQEVEKLKTGDIGADLPGPEYLLCL